MSLPPVVTRASIPPKSHKGDVCYWCDRPLGDLHSEECVVWVKRCKVVFTIMVETEEPVSFDRHNIEFRYNDGSWCADNLIGVIEDQIEREGMGCLCDNVHARVVHMGKAQDKERTEEEAHD